MGGRGCGVAVGEFATALSDSSSLVGLGRRCGTQASPSRLPTGALSLRQGSCPPPTPPRPAPPHDTLSFLPLAPLPEVFPTAGLTSSMFCLHVPQPQPPTRAPTYLLPLSPFPAAVFPSADFLVDEVEGVARDLAAVHTPRAAAAVRRAVADLFQVTSKSRPPAAPLLSATCFAGGFCRVTRPARLGGQ